MFSKYFVLECFCVVACDERPAESKTSVWTLNHRLANHRVVDTADPLGARDSERQWLGAWESVSPDW